jgi:hypothetical protein
MEGKRSRKRVWLAVGAIILGTGLFLSLNSAWASVACHQYKDYRRKFHNEEDKEEYFKIKWLEKHDNKSYMFYKFLCDSHKFDSKAEFGKLSEKTQKMCHEYYTHEGYENYLEYKKKCHKDDDEDVILPPQPEPEPDPELPLD